MSCYLSFLDFVDLFALFIKLMRNYSGMWISVVFSEEDGLDGASCGWWAI